MTTGLTDTGADYPSGDLTFMWQSEIRRTLSNWRMFSMNKHYDKLTLMIQ